MGISASWHVGLAALVAVSGGVASAEDSAQNPRSKENVVFETQGSVDASGFVRGIYDFIVDNQILADGTLSVGYNALLTDQQTGSNLDVAVETRVYSSRARKLRDRGGLDKAFAEREAQILARIKAEGDCRESYGDEAYCQREKAAIEKQLAALRENPRSVVGGGYSDLWDDHLLFPVEYRLRVNLESGAVDTKELRVGLFRFLNDNGIQAQILSYVFRNYDLGVGTIHAFEGAQLAFNEAFYFEDSKVVELVVKGTASLGGGVMAFGGQAIQGAAAQANLPDEANPSKSGWYVRAGGSVGIRIAKKVLVDVFGGVDYFGGGDDKKDVKNTYWGMVNTYYGAGVRYTPVPWFSAQASIRRDTYDTTAEFENLADGVSAKTKDVKQATTAAVAAEVRW